MSHFGAPGRGIPSSCFVALALLLGYTSAGCATASDAPDGGAVADAAVPTPDAEPGIPDASLGAPDANAIPDATPVPDAAIADADMTPDADTTPDADLTPDADTTPDAAGCTDTVVQLLASPGFDSGPAVSWTTLGGEAVILSQAGSPAFPFTPDSPLYAAWLGGIDASRQALYQDVIVPAGATAPQMGWKYVIGTQETFNIPYDTFTLTVRDPGTGAVLETVVAYDNTDETGSTTWQTGTKNLGNYAGQTVRVYLDSTTDVSNPSNFFLDSLLFNVTVCQ